VQGVRRVALNNSRDPQRPLRVGFVSGDLRTHAMMHFIEPIWRHLDRDMYPIYVYHTGEIEDHATKGVAELAHVWRRVRGLDAARLRDRIVEDGIDVLFDLSGHTDANRLLTFAMRAAPVQISWLGYPTTTGVAEMDYYLVDRHVAPPGLLDAQFTEKLAYLPASFTFQPHWESPEVNAAPALKNGVLALWARVLARVPDAKMLLGHVPEESVSELLERFARFGVSADRLVLRPRAGMRTYLGYHHEVDIVLDTFPYTGGTTSCHSLWMGVPILTLAGDTRTSRQTACVLGVAGLQQWVSTSGDELVEKAAAWAGNVPALAALRAGMRDQLRASPFARGDLVAQALQRAMRQMWTTWCNGDPATSFEVAP
jgi:predicted O-linked N-acetylglucosamine transferase (SPINDLY family)